MIRAACVAALIALGCHSHAHAPEPRPHGNDHHTELSTTAWSDGHEVFATHKPAVAGKTVPIHIHVTSLDAFAPVRAGPMVLRLDGPKTLETRVEAPSEPGVFATEIVLPEVGTYEATVIVGQEPAAVVTGLSFHAFGNAHAADHALMGERHDHQVSFTKEQQWRLPFGTARAARGEVSAAMEVPGRIGTPPEGTAIVAAPVIGRLLPPDGGFPLPGSAVRKGQVLAKMAPIHRDSLAEARGRAEAAATSRERFERLYKDDAVSLRELEDARRESDIASASLRAAEQSTGRGGGSGVWNLVSPIDGTLASMRAHLGALSGPNDVPFVVVDTRTLWVTARVPEHLAVQIDSDRPAQFQPEGSTTWWPIAALSTSRWVDPDTRTVDVVYATTSVDPTLRVGGLARVHVPTGRAFDGVVVPREAVIDDDGRDVVFVQVEGERFEERTVRLGPASGGVVGIVDGVEAGERVVAEGANLLRLADRARGPAAHGHVH